MTLLLVFPIVILGCKNSRFLASRVIRVLVQHSNQYHPHSYKRRELPEAAYVVLRILTPRARFHLARIIHPSPQRSEVIHSVKGRRGTKVPDYRPRHREQDIFKPSRLL
jgi:hypothetical protein